ncbi:MAG TPA: 50S rRNA methyltransferase [Clostridiales bacterium]|nr:50S rRNA methyltransferase [Clostridiales bacterium]
MTSLFSCPICAHPLQRDGRTYRCSQGHCYDMAREGYVHLLPANKKHSANPGDDREMAAARTRFLDGGWYAPLRDTLCRLTLEHTPHQCAVLDAGCGEGYYTQGLYQTLERAGRQARVAGIDLSKFALKKAARRAPQGEFAVASVYHLPVADSAVDVLVDCFAPLAAEEYRRVVRPGGVFLYVVPAPDHLMELKQVLYPQPYRNPEEAVTYPGFSYLDILPVTQTMHIRDRQTLMDLFRMTPYAWKTPKEGVERLSALEGLDVTMDFRVHLFAREG